MQEIELAYLAKVTQPDGFKQAAAVEGHLQFELRGEKGRCRVRRTTKHGNHVYTMTAKVKATTGDKETTIQIEKPFFDAFAMAAGNGQKKVRHTYPSNKVTLTIPGQAPVILPNIVFEVDRFYNNQGKPGKFVKIDVEVQSIVQYIKDNNLDIKQLKILVDFSSLNLGIMEYFEMEDPDHAASKKAFLDAFRVDFAETTLAETTAA